MKSIPSIWETVAIELLILFLDLSFKWIKKNDKGKLKAYVWTDPSKKNFEVQLTP